VGIDERAACPHAERGLEIDDVGDLAQLGELRAHLERNPRQAVGDDLHELAHRFGDRRRAKQTHERRRRRPLVDRARDPFGGVDVPPGRALVPAALQQREAPPVARPLEARLGDDGLASDHLEVEARLERLVRKAQLHEGRLDSTRRPFKAARGPPRLRHARRRRGGAVATSNRRRRRSVPVGRRVQRLPAAQPGSSGTNSVSTRRGEPC
jgi:hypothetical protein